MQADTELPAVLPPPDQKSEHVQRMFSDIAPRYDLLNHVLSLNIDRRWRRAAIDRLNWQRVPDGLYLDSCSGTLDLAVELARRERFTGTVIGSDFALPMLQRGEHKLPGLHVRPVCADSLRLPFADGCFDGATVGFGVRNLADLSSGLSEFTRVLKPGARLVILEFTTPTWQPFRGLYFLYFRRILPLIGALVSSHESAYSYLPESVLGFPEPPRLGLMMAEAGFTRVRWEALSGGIAALHWGTRS